MPQTTKQLIEGYYQAFNKGDMEKFFSYLDDNIIHDINQGTEEHGKVAFEKFMQHMNYCYKEHIRDLVVMVNEHGDHAAAAFIVEGEYLATDKGLPEARNQKYRLPAGAFFKVKNNKITRVTVYYNVQDWLKQVK